MNVAEAPGRLDLSGRVGFDDALAVTRRVEAVIAGSEGEGLTISLEGVDSANSVVVALMMGWLRAAREHAVDVVFAGVSGRLADVVTFSGLDGVLPMTQESAA